MMTDLNELIKYIREIPDIDLVIVFGSMAQEAEKEDSDVDIAIAGTRLLPVDQKIQIQVALAKQLPREVDLIDLHEVSGIILQQILTTGRIVKHAPLIYAGLIKKMWFNQADMMPLTKQILYHHCQRFIYG